MFKFTGWLSRLTKHPTEQNNVKSLGLSMLIKNADLPLFTGTELQTFQVKAGLNTTQIGMLGFFGQISSIVSMFLLMGFADRVKNRVLANAWLTLAMAVYPVVLVAMSAGPALFREPSVMFPTMAVLQIVESAIMATIGMVFAPLYVRAISNEIRGRFTALIGVTGGLVGILLGLANSWVLGRLGYPYGFSVAFVLSVILLVAAAWAVKHVKEVPHLCIEEKEECASPWPSWRSEGRRSIVDSAKAASLALFGPVLTVVKLREFRLLAPPNILRGLGDGAAAFVMAVGLRQLNLGVEYAGYTTSLIYLGGLLGTGLIGMTVDRYGSGPVLFVADTAVAIALMGVVLAGGPIVFLAFFLMVQITNTIEGYTVPLAHYAIVPTQFIGAFSGARLMILYGVAAISMPTVGYLLDKMPMAPFEPGFIPAMLPSVGPILDAMNLPQPGYSSISQFAPNIGLWLEQKPAWPVFAVCGGLKVITGFLYWYAFKKGNKQQAKLDAQQPGDSR